MSNPLPLNQRSQTPSLFNIQNLLNPTIIPLFDSGGLSFTWPHLLQFVQLYHHENTKNLCFLIGPLLISYTMHWIAKDHPTP